MYEDVFVDAYNKCKMPPFDKSKAVSVVDFLAVWCADKRDIDKHECVQVFVSGADYMVLHPEDKEGEHTDGRTSIYALAPKRLLLIVSVPSILKEGEIVLMSGDEKAFSPKLVLT